MKTTYCKFCKTDQPEFHICELFCDICGAAIGNSEDDNFCQPCYDKLKVTNS